MQEKLLATIKRLVPELSELEAQGYNLDGVMRGNLAFEINASHSENPTITFAGYYTTNGGETRVKFERFVDEGQSETADFKITRITKSHSLFEQEWEDEDENTRKSASIVINDPAVRMPYPGTVVVNNVHNKMAYKRYLKFNDRHILKSLIPESSGDFSND